MTANGSIGCYSLRRVIGSATVLPDISSGFMFWEANISFLGTDFSKLSDYRYQGWFIGSGIAYGYAWILGRHWNLEAEIGIGYIYTRYDSYPCASCGKKIAEDKAHHYFGPTKAAINLVYTF